MDSKPIFREQVFAGSWVDAELVNNLLVVEGIRTIVANEKTPIYAGPPQRLHAVYVLDADGIERAREIVERVRTGKPLKDPRSYRSWRCPDCNELIEGQFEACWSCGRLRT